MTAPEIIAYAVAILIGVPAMAKNWTAVALVGSFLVVHFAWILTGEGSLALGFMCDYAVVIAILVKVDTRDCSPFGGLWGQIGPCWTEMRLSDRIILVLFVPAWAACAIGMGDALRYWILWGVGVAQFIVAGVEAFTLWRRSRDAKAEEEHPAEPFLRWGLAGDGW